MAPFTRLFKVLAVLCAFAPNSGICSEPVSPRQIVIVVSGSWSDTGARLFRFEKRVGKWEKTGDAVKVVIGEKGMGWGVGVAGLGPAFPLKKEGDRKAPAGIFPLLKAMGYESGPTPSGGFPYEQIKEDTRCVDDPGSAFYNMIVQERDFHVPVAGLWNSSEQMKCTDEMYKRLVVVGYNVKSPQPGAGSCIFMHIWRSPATATTGCTAMAEKDLVEILNWLKAEDHPVLVQLPIPVYGERWKELDLPAPELLTGN